MTNPRDLIQRLADSVELLLQMRNGLMPLVNTEAALAEARAYLAKPKPEPKKPTIMEICELAEEIEEEELGEVDLVRRALARWGNHAPQLLPAKPGSADHIVNDDGIPWHQTTNALLWAQAFGALFPEMAPHEDLMLSWFANAIMTGWDHHGWKMDAERTPIPLSERLPEAEDCAEWPDELDAGSWCWAAVRQEKDEEWVWQQCNSSFLPAHQASKRFDALSHWLPHWAIPVPQEEGR